MSTCKVLLGSLSRSGFCGVFFGGWGLTWTPIHLVTRKSGQCQGGEFLDQIETHQRLIQRTPTNLVAKGTKHSFSLPLPKAPFSCMSVFGWKAAPLVQWIRFLDLSFGVLFLSYQIFETRNAQSVQLSDTGKKHNNGNYVFAVQLIAQFQGLLDIFKSRKS